MALHLSQYALPLFIALIALEDKSLSMTGAISAVLMAYIILITQSIYWFLIILVFYAIATAATKWKDEKKRKKQLIQKTRGPWNIVGNGAIALIMAILGGPIGLIGYVGAFATASADTVSSEIGVLSKSRPRMITNFKKIDKGDNGGVTLLGTSMGIIAAFLIGLFSLIIAPWYILPIAVFSGFIGCLADSFIGALWEDGKIVGNSLTNFLATSVGCVSAMIISILFI